jgi:glycosyltransferase involved in cell wall biosynthesis
LVTIIIPTFNCELYIRETFESLKRQSYDDFEAIIIDNASTDGTVDLITNLTIKDSRFKIIKLDKNLGAAGGRNTGIEIASRKYISFLDSDDLWLPQKLEKQVEFMENNDYDFTYTYYEKVDQEGKSLGKIKKSNSIADYKSLLKTNFIGCSTVMYNQEALGKIYMPQIAKRNDYATWLAILKKIENGYCLEEVLVQYRVHENSLSSNKLNLVKYNWKLFRDLEGFGRIKSSYYLFWNILNKILE